VTDVYHFTDTARLPWIIASGELRASDNRISGFPDDLVWATTNPGGDKTASASFSKALHKEGFIQIVRFTLDADEFAPWRDVVVGLPAWTEKHVADLEQAAKAKGQDPACWRARVGPVPAHRWLAVDAKRHNDGWRRIAATPANCMGSGPRRGFVIDGYAYIATQERDGAGHVSYSNLTRAGVTET
jgi:hypothetical protein